MKNILWDFDGVILDSMKVRDYGFEEIFNKYPKTQVNDLIQYHRLNGGLSRYVKIRYFYEKILKKPISEEKVHEYANQFTTIMRSTLTDSSYLISDTVEYLKRNIGKFNFHIVSGSDQAELRFLCKELNINDLFLSIEGSPTPKTELIKNLLVRYNYKKEDTCLIGDSFNDFEAADSNGLAFYGYNNKELVKIEHTEYINDFDHFEFS